MSTHAFSERAQQLYETGLFLPRLAHFVGSSTTHNVALFSHIDLDERSGLPREGRFPRFLALVGIAGTRRWDSHAAAREECITWAPGSLTLLLGQGEKHELIVPLPREGGPDVLPPPAFDGQAVTLEPSPPMPTYDLPASAYELKALLVQHGNTGGGVRPW